MIEEILTKFGLLDHPVSLTQFHSEEDGAPYNVWCVRMPDREYVLKEAKGYESEIYRAFLSHPCSYAPKPYGSAVVGGKEYLLVEYIPGESMTKCSRKSLKMALDSLIAMQTAHWESTESAGGNYERTLGGRQNREKYLNDPKLEAAYELFLREFEALPRTLCHDDLLPFNVIISGDRAVFVDWEAAGILPYPVSIARLIAHGDESEDAFFYMKNEDRFYAIDYYYRNFIGKMGIAYTEYRRSLDLFLFYEYCEWVYVGNKYGETDNDRFRSYLKKAKEQAASILK